MLGGDSIDGEQDLLGTERGAAHSNTQGKGDKSRDSFPDYSESIEGTRGQVGQKRQRRQKT